MIDYADLRAALGAGGLLPGEIEAGRLVRCPVEGDRKGKKSGAYRLFDDELPTCAWWNWRDGSYGVWVSGARPPTDADRNRHRKMIEQSRREREVDQAEQWKRNRGYLLRLWAAARPLSSSCPASLYLINRGLEVPATGALRFIPSLDYWDDSGMVGTFPALLAAVTSPAGELVALHRTYLTRSGHKAPVPTAKKLTRTAGPMAGASIKIGAPVKRPEGSTAVGVAEGIETALAAALLSGLPVWPCVSAHGLTAFVVPPEVQSLYVFGDRDENGVGQRAAGELAARAAASGLVARILLPDVVGDWNDELLTRRAAV